MIPADFPQKHSRVVRQRQNKSQVGWALYGKHVQYVFIAHTLSYEHPVSFAELRPILYRALG